MWCTPTHPRARFISQDKCWLCSCGVFDLQEMFQSPWRQQQQALATDDCVGVDMSGLSPLFGHNPFHADVLNVLDHASGGPAQPNSPSTVPFFSPTTPRTTSLSPQFLQNLVGSSPGPLYSPRTLALLSSPNPCQAPSWAVSPPAAQGARVSVCERLWWLFLLL